MRLEVSARADLAIRSMLLLADQGRRMKAGELAALVGSTPTYLPQVLRPLVTLGWLRSEPGPAGGYTNVVAVEDVSVLAVIEAVEGPTENGRCVLAARPCDAQRQCALHAPWQLARDELLSSLAGTRLSAIPRSTIHPPMNIQGARS